MLKPLSASLMAAQVQQRSISAYDTALAALARRDEYDKIQPQIWIHRQSNNAVLSEAKLVDQRLAVGEYLPLAGVPYAVKDNIDIAGIPTTAGCPEFSYVPERSATVIDKLAAAGAVLLGKTNLDQFATGLVGTRSPFGKPACAFNLDYISGGSSSGSAVATAAGVAAFALGTDTAGSGRVPAAFNNLIGLKPTKGRWSSYGLVPACRSLDCITVFASKITDIKLVDEVIAGFDEEDIYSRDDESRKVLPSARRIGVPLPKQLTFLGDVQAELLFNRAIGRAEKAGAEIIRIDIEPLLAAAQLLYAGPWVAERVAALEGFLRRSPGSIDPVVRSILHQGQSVTGMETFLGMYDLKRYERAAARIWREVDIVMLPTTPTIYRICEVNAAPFSLNSNLGLYTNFVNLLDMCAIAMPSGFRDNRTGFGVTFIGPAFADNLLCCFSEKFEETFDMTTPPLDLKSYPGDRIKLAVVGAHLEGMPLHWQLTSRGATLISSTRTAPSYRLYAIAESNPPKPALIHVGQYGSEIDVEVYELDVAAFGSFVAEVPAPLAIGTVILADGTFVKGFVAEPRAIIGANDITEWGSWRAYIASVAVTK